MGLGAVYMQAGDPADVVKLVDVDEPRDPGPGQVLIRVTLFPIHWGDLQAIQYGSPSGQVRAGVEATGVVEKVGPGVHHVTAGARVSVFPHPGAWAERITADAQFVVPVPDSVSDEIAAQMLVNPLTVLMLRREAEKQFSTGYDGVVLNNAAGARWADWSLRRSASTTSPPSAWCAALRPRSACVSAFPRCPWW
jgi:NADPH:quinone reductase-like Zn-dependent oxidoreductase